MKTEVKKIVITGLLIGLGLLLPTFFHMFGAGTVMLPMHIPVLLCGLVCGMPYGAACGIILPLLSSAVTGMPPIFPTGLSMSLELCAYGLMCGLLYRRLGLNIYVSLVGSMLAGRVVKGIASAVLLGMANKPYGLVAFLTESFVVALPGIIIQIIFVPLIVMALQRAHLVEKPVRRLKPADA